jgi:hypothetical protein
LVSQSTRAFGGTDGREMSSAQQHGALTSRFCLREPLVWPDRVDGRLWGPPGGDMERTGMLGGGPGSAAGERRCAKERWEGFEGCILAKEL